ncbi:hypothetical protein PoB_007002600 [Plakobranchus ocellatus]|uniref:Uncharacterized protein n=1 Tax=Plakobranchus ocellatus TaxID=259542 RepID=A0AAV4DH68_9GAST|nr:hypothetical protein PoB_007002600 [Plakobranchus ocellatus]
MSRLLSSSGRPPKQVSNLTQRWFLQISERIRQPLRQSRSNPDRRLFNKIRIRFAGNIVFDSYNTYIIFEDDQWYSISPELCSDPSVVSSSLRAMPSPRGKA